MEVPRCRTSALWCRLCNAPCNRGRVHSVARPADCGRPGRRRASHALVHGKPMLLFRRLDPHGFSRQQKCQDDGESSVAAMGGGNVSRRGHLRLRLQSGELFALLDHGHRLFERRLDRPRSPVLRCGLERPRRLEDVSPAAAGRMCGLVGHPIHDRVGGRNAVLRGRHEERNVWRSLCPLVLQSGRPHVLALWLGHAGMVGNTIPHCREGRAAGLGGGPTEVVGGSLRILRQAKGLVVCPCRQTYLERGCIILPRKEATRLITFCETDVRDHRYDPTIDLP